MNPLEDPLDREDFDSVQYINQLFPTESSLNDLDSFVANIGSQISTLDAEISKAVQNQSHVGRQATKDIQEAQEHIEELFNKIQDIKQKASQSESMVQDLCADIKKLDYAKNHLQTSITSLNRLQMLINAVNQLEMLANDHQYKEVANLLDAVKQFMSHFEKYKHIAVISDLNKRIDRIRDGLIQHIRAIFKEVADKIDTVADAELLVADLPGGLKTLSDACTVVDSLGHTVRREFFDDFVRSQLVAYDNLFGHDKQHFSLDQVERRWAWFKRLLKYIDNKFGNIFPAHWRLPLRLCLEFVERTKMHLILLLTEVESNENSDVQQLLKALQSALRFEQEMADHFNLLKALKHSREAEEQLARTRAAEVETQKRLKKESKLMYIPTDHDAENKEEETESGFLGLAHAAISGGISGVFDKFLGSYVALVRQNLDDTMHRVVEEDMTGAINSADGHHGSVFGSATSMFVFIKNSIKQCIALTNGQTFLLLSEEFQECMREYMKTLMQRCPPENPHPPLGYRLGPNMEIQICYIVNTGEYCAEVVPQLEQMIQAKIIPSLANKINYSEEVDCFLDLAAHGARVLVFGLMDRLEPGFRAMQSINWGAFTLVGEESQYVHLFNSILVDAMPKIKSALSSTYFNNMCNKVATEVLQRFEESIMKAKRISDIATQQLLLDTYSLKTLLLALPALTEGATASALTKAPPPSAMYAKLINGKAAHIEVILKLIGTPEEVLVERFRILWDKGSATDLQNLMQLKGTKRNDQQVLLEMFGLATASAKAPGKPNGAQAGNGAHPPNISSTASNAAQSIAATTASFNAASAAASAAAFSSMKSLTQDFSSTAKSAMGNLKWGMNKNQQS